MKRNDWILITATALYTFLFYKQAGRHQFSHLQHRAYCKPLPERKTGNTQPSLVAGGSRKPCNSSLHHYLWEYVFHSCQSYFFKSFGRH
jgi:hypothetical protein